MDFWMPSLPGWSLTQPSLSKGKSSSHQSFTPFSWIRDPWGLILSGGTAAKKVFSNSAFSAFCLPLACKFNSVTAEESYRPIAGITSICEFSGVYLEGASNYFKTAGILRNNFWREFLFTLVLLLCMITSHKKYGLFNNKPVTIFFHQRSAMQSFQADSFGPIYYLGSLLCTRAPFFFQLSSVFLLGTFKDPYKVFLYCTN